MATYGGTGTLTERLRRVGSAEATFNDATMRHAGLQVPMVWVDVEPYRVAPWSQSHASNNACSMVSSRATRRQGFDRHLLV